MNIPFPVTHCPSVSNLEVCIEPARNPDQVVLVHHWTKFLLLTLQDSQRLRPQYATLAGVFELFLRARAFNGYADMKNLDLFRGEKPVDLLGVRASSWHRWVCRFAEFNLTKLFWSFGYDIASVDQEDGERILNASIPNTQWLRSRTKKTVQCRNFEIFEDLNFELQNALARVSHKSAIERRRARVRARIAAGNARLAQHRFERVRELLEAERAQKTQLQSELDQARKFKECLEDDADIQRKQLGLKLWNAGLSWSKVAEKVDGTPETWKAVKEEIRRFARKNKLEIRLGKPGAKRQT